MTRQFFAAALAAALIAGAAPAMAQDQTEGQLQNNDPATTGETPDQTAPYQQQETFTLTDEQVDAFVEAARGINELVEEVQPEMAAAETPEEQQRIQTEAQAEMATIVENSGLTVVEYNSIANAARNDESVANRIREAAGVAPEG